MFPAIEVNRGLGAGNLSFPDAPIIEENSEQNKQRSNRKHEKVMKQLNRALDEEQEKMSEEKKSVLI